MREPVNRMESNRLDVSGSDCITAVGAHPGDIELMCGAVLVHLASSGVRCVAVHVSDGSQGNPSSDPHRYAEQKREEALAFGRDAGIEVRFLDFPDGYVVNGADLRRALVAQVRELRPRVVITHWRGSFHPDHRAVHAAVHDAALQAALPWEGAEHQVDLICYGENWEDHQDFTPDLYLDVSEACPKWKGALEHLAMWRGGVAPFRYRQYYESLVGLRGAECGCDYAQALMLAPHKAPIPHRTIPPALRTHVY